jgi:hypothetical protein
MAYRSNKESQLLKPPFGNSGGDLSGSKGDTARRVILLSALLCALAASATITHRILSKVHLKSVGGRMKARLGGLLKHLPHVGPREFEAYVYRNVNGALLRRIDSHLRVCEVCREEVEIVRQVLASGPGSTADAYGTAAPQVRQSFHWGDNSTLWIDDEAYPLRPVGDTRTVVLVEGLKFSGLEKMLEEDARVPGTHLVSLEGQGVDIIVPLSKFGDVSTTPTSADSGKHPSCSTVNAGSADVLPPALAGEGKRLPIEMFTDAQNAVFLGVRSVRT